MVAEFVFIFLGCLKFLIFFCGGGGGGAVDAGPEPAYEELMRVHFPISRGFYFHETLHMRSFAKIKPSQKFPNLQ